MRHASLISLLVSNMRSRRYCSSTLDMAISRTSWSLESIWTEGSSPSGLSLPAPSFPTEARTFAALGRDDVLTPGTTLPKPKGVFPRHQTAKDGEGA